MLDNEYNIIEKKRDFILELCGEKSFQQDFIKEEEHRSYLDQDDYIAQKNNRDRGPNLKNLVVDEVFKNEETEGFTHLGSVTVSKRFKPTITDMKLLIGTKEWADVKKYENIDETTVD